jgi:hypothetical protein
MARDAIIGATVRPAGATNEMFGVTPRRTCVVADSFWENGEGHYQLEDVDTGEVFESPDVFWAEVRPCPDCKGGLRHSPEDGRLVECSRCGGTLWVRVD